MRSQEEGSIVQKDQRNLRSINITQALIYPFLRQNVVNTLLIPGAVVLSLVLIVIRFRHLVPMLLIPGMTEESAPPFWLDLSLSTLPLLPLLGCGWRLVGVLRKDGYDALFPNWTLEKIMGSFWDGLKLVLLISPLLLIMMLPESLNLIPLANYLAAHRYGVEVAQRFDANTAEFPVDPAQMKQKDNNPSSFADLLVPPRIDPTQMKQMDRNPSSFDARLERPPVDPEQLKQWVYVLCIAVSMLLMPFFMGAVVQSAETRGALRLLNISCTWQAGVKCYGKSLLVSFAVALFILCLPGIGEQWFFGGKLLVPYLVIMTLISFHLIAQAYDDYRDEHLRPSEHDNINERTPPDNELEPAISGSLGRLLTRLRRP